MAEEKPGAPKPVVDPTKKRGGASRSEFANANALSFKDVEAKLRAMRPGSDYEQLPQETAYVPSDAEKEFVNARPVIDPDTKRVIRGPVPKLEPETLRPTMRQSAMAQADASLPVPKFSEALLAKRSEKINEAGEEADLNDPKTAYANVRESIRVSRTAGFQQAAARSQNQLAGLEEVQSYSEDRNNNANFAETEFPQERAKREASDEDWERNTGRRNRGDSSWLEEHNANSLPGLEIPSSMDLAKYHQLYTEDQLPRQAGEAPHGPHQNAWGFAGDYSDTGESLGRIPGTQAEMDKALAEGRRLTGQHLSSIGSLPEGQRESAYAEVEAGKGTGEAFGSLTGTSHKLVKATHVERSLNTSGPNMMGYPTGITETPTDRIHVVHMDGNTRIGHTVLPANGGTVTDITPTGDGGMNHIATTYDGSGNQVSSVETPLRVSRTGLSPEESEQVRQADPQVIVHNGTVLHRPEDQRPLDVIGQAKYDADQAEFSKLKSQTDVIPPQGDSGKETFYTHIPEKKKGADAPVAVQADVPDEVRSARADRINALYAASGKTQNDVTARMMAPRVAANAYTVRHLVGVQNGVPVHSAPESYTANSPEHAVQQHLLRNPGVGGLTVSGGGTRKTDYPQDWFESNMGAARTAWRKVHGGEAHSSEYQGTVTQPWSGVDTAKLQSKTGGILPSPSEMDASEYMKPNPGYLSPEAHAAKVLSSQSDIDLLHWHLKREAQKAHMAHALKVQAVANGGASRESLLGRVIQAAQPKEPEEAGPVE